MTKIYLVENCYNDPNKVYIGKTKNNRESNHRKKFGEQIKYTYIDEINSLDRKDWEPLESYWIEQFRQWGFEVVNVRKKGGSGPEYYTEEIKLKISKSNSKPKPLNFGEIISNIKKGKPNLKNKFKPEGFAEKLKKPHKGGENISKAKKGKPSTKKNKKYGPLIDSQLKNISRKKIVLQIDPITNKIVQEWGSRNQIKKEIGSGIVGAIRENRIYKNYIWKYK
jgi:hypothetical protein